MTRKQRISKIRREAAAARKTFGAGSGRPPIETPCPKCGEICPSARKAAVHCS